MEWKKNT